MVNHHQSGHCILRPPSHSPFGGWYLGVVACMYYRYVDPRSSPIDLSVPLIRHKRLRSHFPAVFFFYSPGAAGLSSSLFTAPAATATPFSHVWICFCFSILSFIYSLRNFPSLCCSKWGAGLPVYPLYNIQFVVGLYTGVKRVKLVLILPFFAAETHTRSTTPSHRPRVHSWTTTKTSRFWDSRSSVATCRGQWSTLRVRIPTPVPWYDPQWRATSAANQFATIRGLLSKWSNKRRRFCFRCVFYLIKIWAA